MNFKLNISTKVELNSNSSWLFRVYILIHITIYTYLGIAENDLDKAEISI